MVVRYAENNWSKYFDGSGKKTTIRHHELKTGFHATTGGSRFKPKRLGSHYVHPYSKMCLVKELTEQDARNDGFNNLCELLLELAKRNPTIQADTQVWIHPTSQQKDERLENGS